MLLPMLCKTTMKFIESSESGKCRLHARGIKSSETNRSSCDDLASHSILGCSSWGGRNLTVYSTLILQPMRSSRFSSHQPIATCSFLLCCGCITIFRGWPVVTCRRATVAVVSLNIFWGYLRTGYLDKCRPPRFSIALYFSNSVQLGSLASISNKSLHPSPYSPPGPHT